MRRVTVIAALLLIVLRVAIGWQLLYEGIWKVKTLRSATPWTSAGYLKNSQGPLRDHFRELAGNVDDLDWINVDKMSAKWDAWQNRFVAHYGLDDRQKSQLNKLINGSTFYHGELAEWPAEVDLQKLKLHTIVSYDAERKILKLDGERPIQPREKAKLIGAVNEGPGGDAFREAVEKAYLRAKRGLGAKRKLAGWVKGNPEWVTDESGQRLGEIDKYKGMLADYEAARKEAETDFNWDHVNYAWGKVQKQRGDLIGPVRAIDDELKSDAMDLLTVDQIRKGPAPEPWTPLRISDRLTIAGLCILGACLMLGLLTRTSAFFAAIMIFMFYMAQPPWPGVPPAPGPEHSFIVNKNLIEVFALLAIAFLPTGRWFGVDGLVGWMFKRGK